jgi:uncharacterized membrane-anchored protein
MKPPARWVLWLVLGLVQVGVPVLMIVQKEAVMDRGVEIRLKLRPVDPADPFRGRYLALRYEVEERDYTLPEDPTAPLFALLETGEDGFAVIREITTDASFPGALRVERVTYDPARIRIPWNRYFVNEERAPLIEEEVRNATRNGEGPPVYARLRIAGGDAVLTGLWIGERPLR